MNHINHDSFILFYDDHCPLCMRVMMLINTYVQPECVEMVPLSDSRLDPYLIDRAYSDILLWHPDNFPVWGYDSYCFIFERSSSRFRPAFRILSFVMRVYLVYPLGKLVYRLISSSRKRCDDNCALK